CWDISFRSLVGYSEQRRTSAWPSVQRGVGAILVARNVLVAFGATLIVAFAEVAAGAAEIKVLGAVAMQAALDDIARAFERTTAHKVTISYATAGVLSNRIQSGESADVTILPKPVF